MVGVCDGDTGPRKTPVAFRTSPQTDLPSSPSRASAASFPPASDPRDFSDIKSLDPAANVEALRHSLAITKKLLDDAMVGTDENLISLRTRNYNSTFDLWRLAEQTLVKVQRERGEVIEREAIAAEIAQACETLALMRQSMPARILVELEKILPRRLSRILKALQPHLLTAVDHVRSSEEQILRNLTAIDSPPRFPPSLPRDRRTRSGWLPAMALAPPPRHLRRRVRRKA
jgi:hypothetical protein